MALCSNPKQLEALGVYEIKTIGNWRLLCLQRTISAHQISIDKLQVIAREMTASLIDSNEVIRASLVNLFVWQICGC